MSKYQYLVVLKGLAIDEAIEDTDVLVVIVGSEVLVKPSKWRNMSE